MISLFKSKKAAIKLLLIDDNQLLLRGLEGYLQSEAADIEIIGKAQSAGEGFALARELAPDVILLDFDLTGLSALSVLVQFVKKGKPRVLVYTGERDTSVHREAVLLGARGVLAKTEAPAVIIKAIRRVAAGELWIDRASASELLKRLMYDGPPTVTGIDDPRIAELTRRERDIVKYVCKHPGEPTKRLASSLDISEQTLRNHLSTIYKKLRVNTRADMHALAEKVGLISRVNRPGNSGPSWV